MATHTVIDIFGSIIIKANPVLSAGEPGFELDTGKLKIGDGSTYWNDLPYLAEGYIGDIETAIDNIISLQESLIGGNN